jgi:hypothetical protein
VTDSPRIDIPTSWGVPGVSVDVRFLTEVLASQGYVLTPKVTDQVTESTCMSCGMTMRVTLGPTTTSEYISVISARVDELEETLATIKQAARVLAEAIVKVDEANPLVCPAHGHRACTQCIPALAALFPEEPKKP